METGGSPHTKELSSYAYFAYAVDWRTQSDHETTKPCEIPNSQEKELLNTIAKLSKASPLTRDSFINFVRNSDFRAAHKCIEKLDLPLNYDDKANNNPLILFHKILSRAWRRIEVKPGSCAIKIHDLSKQESTNLHAAFALRECDIITVLAACACIIQLSCQFTTLFISLIADQPTTLEFYPRVPHPSIKDATTVAFFFPQSANPYGGKRFAMSVAKAIHFYHTEQKKARKSFLFLWIDEEHPLNLVDAFSRSKGVTTDSLLWADEAVSFLKVDLPREIVVDPHKRCVTPPRGCFVLLTWGDEDHDAFYNDVAQLAGSLIGKHWSNPPPSAPAKVAHTAAVLPVADISKEIYRIFTPEVAHDIFAQANQNCHRGLAEAADKYIRNLDLDSLTSTPTETPALTATEGLVCRIGANSLQPVARVLDKWGGDGVGIYQLFHWAFAAFVKPLDCALLGDNIRTQEASQEEFTKEAGNITVYNSPGKHFVKRFNDKKSLLEQIEYPGQLLGTCDGKTRLYHGTTVEAATNIANFGFDRSKASQYSDFGEAFYTTTSFSYAVECAYLNYLADNRSKAPAVLIFELDDNYLEGLKSLPKLESDLEFWKKMVCACRRQYQASWYRELAEDDQQKWSAAEVLHGPVTNNAQQVDRGTSPRPLDGVTQHAFPFDRYCTKALHVEEHLRSVVRLAIKRGEWS